DQLAGLVGGDEQRDPQFLEEQAEAARVDASQWLRRGGCRCWVRRLRRRGRRGRVGLGGHCRSHSWVREAVLEARQGRRGPRVYVSSSRVSGRSASRSGRGANYDATALSEVKVDRLHALDSVKRPSVEKTTQTRGNTRKSWR